MAPPRRATAPAAASNKVNFGELEFYGASFNLPEGDYAMEHNVMLHAYTKQDGSKGQEMLGVMLSAHPLAGGEPLETFLSMGAKAKLSFAPDPNDGKGLVPIPGGPAATLSGMTNWNIYLKSLYDSGLPKGIFINDVSVLDGVWVHTQNIPEPAERKAYAANKSNTGEQAEEGEKKDFGPKLTTVVTEIKDGGAPWEGGGGFDGLGEAAKPGPKAPGKVVSLPAKAQAKAAPAPAAGGDEDVMAAAEAGTSAVLEKAENAAGCTRLALRTGTFKAVQAVYGDETAQAVIETYFADDAAINSVIGKHGYKVTGTKVVPS